MKNLEWDIKQLRIKKDAEIAAKEGELSKAREEINASVGWETTLRDAIRVAQDNERKAIAEKKKAEEKIQSLTAQKAAAESKTSGLSTRVSELGGYGEMARVIEEMMEEYDTLKAELKTQEGEKRLVDDEVINLRALLQTQREEIASLKAQLEAREAENTRLRAENARLYSLHSNDESRPHQTAHPSHDEYPVYRPSNSGSESRDPGRRRRQNTYTNNGSVVDSLYEERSTHGDGDKTRRKRRSKYL